MIAWSRRAAAGVAGAVLCFRFATSGEPAAAACAVVISVSWALDSAFPRGLQRATNSLLMALETLLLAWAAITGIFTWWLVPVASLVLANWSAGEFLARWKEPTAADLSRYLRALGITLGIGTTAGITAALLGNRLSTGFAAGFVLLLLAGGTTLAVLSRASLPRIRPGREPGR